MRGKLLCVCRVYIQDQGFNNFENNKMKLSVNEAKLTNLWARNCGTIQKVLILKVSGPFENGSQTLHHLTAKFKMATTENKF